MENCYIYDAFGNTLEKKEGIRNRILYTGQQYDQETGQYYLRVRYYNSAVGRFTQEDTYRGDGLNLYAYCKNNPVVYYDPSGHDQAVNPSNGTEMTNTVGVENSNLGTSYANTKGEMLTHVPDSNTQVVQHPEVKASNQIKASDATNYWDNYLGSNQTNINPRTGLIDNDRIFSVLGLEIMK